MPISSLFYISSASQAAPALAAVRHGRNLPMARRWTVAWGLAGLAFDAILLFYALRGRNNHWLSYVSGPSQTVLALIALSHWQPSVSGRQFLRVTAVAFVATIVVLVVSVENTATFSLVRRPVESLLLVVASLGTLLLLVRQEQGNLFQRDWFWICVGLALRYGAAVALDPLARLLIGDSRTVVLSGLKVKAVVDMAAYLLIARGVWCPVLPQHSSGRSSLEHSPSLSSSPPSARGS